MNDFVDTKGNKLPFFLLSLPIDTPVLDSIDFQSWMVHTVLKRLNAFGGRPVIAQGASVKSL